MLARLSSRSSLTGLIVLACTLVIAPAASASACAGRGYKVVEKHAEYRILNKVMKTGRFSDWREEFAEPPIGVFACSNRTHKRSYLGLVGHGVDGNAWTNRIVANFRYAACVVGGTNNLDGGGDYYVRLADLKTGKRLGEFAASDSNFSGMSVTKLVLSDSGAIGWIEASETPMVWLRTKGAPRLMATGPDIDPRYLKFGDTPFGRALIWSTGNSVTKSPA